MFSPEPADPARCAKVRPPAGFARSLVWDRTSPLSARAVICLCLCLTMLVSGCGKVQQIGRALKLGPELATTEPIARRRGIIETSAPPARASRSARIRSAGAKIFAAPRTRNRDNIVLFLRKVQERTGRTAVRKLHFAQKRVPPIDTATWFDSKMIDAGDGGSSAAIGIVFGPAFWNADRVEPLVLPEPASRTGAATNAGLELKARHPLRMTYEPRKSAVWSIVRPDDIPRPNNLFYDRMAAARAPASGVGLITNIRQLRYDGQIADVVLPF